MDVNKIVADTNYNTLCEWVIRVSYAHNVSKKQAYHMVLGRVQLEFNEWCPYKNYESFRIKLHKYQNGHRE
jgi:hypothetical protein